MKGDPTEVCLRADGTWTPCKYYLSYSNLSSTKNHRHHFSAGPRDDDSSEGRLKEIVIALFMIDERDEQITHPNSEY